MEVLDTLPSNVRPKLIILTGNGQRELKILKALCKRFDRIRAFFPLAPLGIRKMGLSVLEVIPLLNKKFNVSFFWVLIDSEHIVSNPSIEVERRIGIEPREVHRRVFLATKEGLVVVVTFLGERNIEDLRAKFIKLRFGVDIPPDKNEIRDFYKSRKLDEIEEIKIAPIRVLEEAFREIVDSVKLLERLLS